MDACKNAFKCYFSSSDRNVQHAPKQLYSGVHYLQTVNLAQMQAGKVTPKLSRDRKKKKKKVLYIVYSPNK